MFKKLKRRLFERFLIDDSVEWTQGSDDTEDPLFIEVMDVVSSLLDKATLNPRKRKIIWPDGQKLSINLSVKRIHDQHPGFPHDLIETNVIDWLVQTIPSEYATEREADEWERLVEKWIGSHER